jgi:hypothetical protein
MLSVIGAGLPRTGTSSVKAALEQLGFGPCYHMFEVFAHPDHVDRWLGVGSGADADWDRVFEGYRSTQDWPASYFWRELAEAYPEAKVVLTVREPRRWFESFRSLMLNGPARLASEAGGEAAVHPVLNVTQRMRPMLEGMGQQTFGEEWRGGEDSLTEAVAVAAYERHVAAVREGLPADRLLVFDVREGWGPLCDFLGVDPPAEPFPHLNDAESLKRMFERMAAGDPLSTPFGTVG